MWIIIEVRVKSLAIIGKEISRVFPSINERRGGILSTRSTMCHPCDLWLMRVFEMLKLFLKDTATKLWIS